MNEIARIGIDGRRPVTVTVIKGEPNNDPWPDERADRLKALWGAGLTASQIATVLGTTRNAVIGKVHRMRLPKRQPTFVKPLKATKQHRGTGMDGSLTHVLRRARAKPIPVKEAPYVSKATAWEPIPGTVPVSLIDIETGMCRWPVTGGSCGQPSGTKVYCPTHHALGTTKVDKSYPIGKAVKPLGVAIPEDFGE